MPGTWALTLRSLRQDSRLLRFHLLRFAIAVAVVLGIWAASESARVAEAPGRDLLEALGWANFWAVTIAGVLLFAPTITEEKEDQTLGLLRMTGIGPASLLLGKALPKLVQLLLVLIVQLPVVWLTRTLGGVDWLLMMNVYLLVFGQLIGVVAISMLASVVMRTSAGAVVAAGVLVFFWMVGVFIVWDFLRHRIVAGSLFVPFRPSANLLVPLSPALQLEELLQSGATVSGTYLTVGASLVLAGVASLLSVWSFNYWNQHESTQTELEWLQEKWQRVWFRMTHFRQTRGRAVSTHAIPDTLVSSTKHAVPTPIPETNPDKTDKSRSSVGFSPRCTENHASAWAKAHATGTVVAHVNPVDAPLSSRNRRSYRSWQNAIAWKDYFLLGGGRTGFRVRCAIAGLGMIAIVFIAAHVSQTLTWAPPHRRQSLWYEFTAEAIMYCSALAFGLDLLYLTVNLFAYELRCQTWESLQLLPLPLGTICRRKILGAACHLVPWVVAFLFGLAMGLCVTDMFGYGRTLGNNWRDATAHPLSTMGFVLQVVTQFMTLLLVLTWFSLRFNPWIAIMLTGALYSAIGVGWIITVLITFGIFGGPEWSFDQVLFHVGWIGGISLLGGRTLYSIRSQLRAEEASV